MIVSFGDRATGDLYHGRKSKHVRRLPADIRAVALRKLDMLNAAHSLQDRLEALHGDLKGHHSVRVNDQWRLVFRWVSGDAHDVRITDYHG